MTKEILWLGVSMSFVSVLYHCIRDCVLIAALEFYGHNPAQSLAYWLTFQYKNTLLYTSHNHHHHHHRHRNGFEGVNDNILHYTLHLSLSSSINFMVAGWSNTFSQWIFWLMDDDHSNCESLRKESDSQYPSGWWIPGVIRDLTVMITWVNTSST